MRVLTWNINGLRSAVGRYGTLRNLLEALAADVVCFQEIKIRRNEIERELALVEGWESFFQFSPVRAGPGYSGVATLCKKATASIPVAVEQGITGTANSMLPPAGKPGPAAPDGSCVSDSSHGLHLQICESLGFELAELQALDSEGRVLITDHGPFILVNLYGPALTCEENLEERLTFKLRFYQVLEWRTRRWMSEGRQVIVVGDFNISPHPIDSCDPNPISQFIQRPDRIWLNRLISPEGCGLIDVFRKVHPNRTDAYTCWNTATGARQNNYGTRIDLILATAPGGVTRATAASQPAEATVRAGGLQDAAADTNTSGDVVEHTPSSTAGRHDSMNPAAVLPADGTEASQDWLSSAITGCDIMADFEGSDHAPVWVDLAISLQDLPAGNPKSLPGSGSSIFSGRQVSLKDWLAKQQQQTQSTMVQQQAAAEQQVLQQQQNKLQGSQMRQPDAQLSSSSNSNSSSKTSGKRKVAGFAPASSSKRSASQSSLLGFVRQPAALNPGRQAVVAGNHSDITVASEGVGCKDTETSTLQGALGQQAAGCTVGSKSLTDNTIPQACHHQQQQQLWPATGATAAAVSRDTLVLQQESESRQQHAKAAWQRITRAMQPPLCKGHREVCVIRTVKKKGANFGRQFYVCARADGPPPVGRCDFFEWAGGEKRVKGSK